MPVSAIQLCHMKLLNDNDLLTASVLQSLLIDRDFSGLCTLNLFIASLIRLTNESWIKDFTN